MVLMMHILKIIALDVISRVCVRYRGNATVEHSLEIRKVKSFSTKGRSNVSYTQRAKNILPVSESLDSREGNSR